MNKRLALLLITILTGRNLAADTSVSDFSKKPFPGYPMGSLAAHEEGSGKYRLEFNAKGHVERVAVLQSTGFRRLDETAIFALRQWQLKPGKDLKPRIVPITFTSPAANYFREPEPAQAVTGSNIPGVRPARLFQGVP